MSGAAVARALRPVALWQFTRPHTITATTATVVTMWVIARDVSTGVGALDLAATLAVCLATNVYITGLNQVTDVEIDLINKPWLPVPAGALSRQAALRVSVGCGLGALLGASLLSSWLMVTVAIGLVVGTAYSVPPVRLKRFPVLAALAILAVRGPVLTLGVYLHFTSGGAVTGLVVLVAVVGTVFGLVVALLKDLPDRRGDLVHGIRTFANQRNPTVVLAAAMSLLLITYVVAAGVGFGLDGVDPRVFAPVELTCAALVARTWARTDAAVPPSVARGYRWVWRTFYLHHAGVVLAVLV